jgi:hypothetical protein
MQAFEIFRAGRQTSSAGTTIEFGEDQLRAAVEAYDPAIHEAPIVVGHPKDNGPAYGWIKALSYADGKVTAEPIQVDEAFSEMVQAGRFKKRSASFYTPDSPHNPKPGVFYLRHVGFLGAQPPAVKGLKDVSFADAEEGIVEFSDSYLLAGLFRRMREFFISKFSIDDANAVLPDWIISDMEAEARREAEASQPAAAMPAFNEGDSNMDFKEQYEAEKAKAEAEKARADGLQAKLDQQTADFAEREKQITRKEIEAQVDALVAAGKVLPAKKAGMVDFAMQLDAGTASVDFTEGDKTEKVTMREAYLHQIAAGPVLVHYGEHSADDGERGGDKKSVAQLNAELTAQVSGAKK